MASVSPFTNAIELLWRGHRPLTAVRLADDSENGGVDIPFCQG